MLKIHRWFILLGLLFIVFIALSMDFSAKKEDSDFKKWKDSFVAELEQSGISERTIQKFQEQASMVQSVADLYNVKVNTTTYRISINEETLLKAQVFYKENKSWLEEKKKEFNVSPEIVVAMYAINSSFGEQMGDNSALNVFSTLAYNAASAEEYKVELISFLELVDRGYFDTNVMANNDGTFTYLGIKPTLYVLYGVDGNEDGVVDLFSTREDIMITSFDMLKTLGLDTNSWGNEVALPNTMDFQSKQGMKFLTTLDKWTDMGITSYNDSPLPKDKRSSFLILLEGYSHGVLLYNNFSVMYKTNSNIQKSLDILALSDKVSEYKKVLSYSEQNVKPVAKKKQIVEEVYDAECDCYIIIEDPVNGKKKPKKDDLPVSSKYKELSEVK